MKKHYIIQTIWSIFWTLMIALSAIFAVFGTCATNILAIMLYFCSTELAFTDYKYAFEKGIINYANKRKM